MATTKKQVEETIQEETTVLDSTETMSKEEILEQEGNLLSNLLDLAKRKENEAFFRKIDIQANGETKISFRLRPMSSEDVANCVKQATKLVKNHRGKAETEVDQRLYQSILIYEATIPEDQKAIWGNPQLKRALGVLDNFDTVDKLLLAGEKAQVFTVIDEMSGFNQEAVNTAKN